MGHPNSALIPVCPDYGYLRLKFAFISSKMNIRVHF